MTILIAILGTFVIGVVVFGGGQVFMPLFKSLWELMGVEADIIDNIFAISNATPGVLSTQLAVFTGFLAGGDHWSAWLLMIATYLVYCIPAMFFVVFATKMLTKSESSVIFKDLIKLLQPVVVGIVIALVIQLFITTALPSIIFNSVGTYFGFDNTTEKAQFFSGWRGVVLIVWTSLVTIESAYFYTKKVKLVYLIAIHAVIGLVLFAPWLV